MAEEARFSPYECTLRPGLKLGIFAVAFFGLGGLFLIGVAAPRHVPLVLNGVWHLSAGQAAIFWDVIGALCLAVAAVGLGGSIYQRRRPRQLRIERDLFVLRDVATGRELNVRYADVTQAVRTVQSRVRLVTVRHPGGLLNLPAAQFPSNEVFDQAARLIIERVKVARARASSTPA